MVRENNRNSIHILTTPLHPPATYVAATKELEGEEFDESDVVWFETNDNNPDHNDNNSTNDSKTNGVSASFVSSPRGYTAGISAAVLSDSEPRSPTSIQRNTTSSPVSMISLSLAKSNSSNSSGTMLGSYYNRRFHMSAPVNVPVWPNRLQRRFGSSLNPFDEGGDDEEGVQDDEEMVPPHEMVARSHNMTTFSVYEGAGRTLKGRDLTAVRNAVFQQTGFLD